MFVSILLRGTGAFFIVLAIPGIMCIAMALILDRLDENRRYLKEVLRRLPEGQNGKI
ncbi:hypothetical protein D3C74_459510 [compost metagenome]